MRSQGVNRPQKPGKGGPGKKLEDIKTFFLSCEFKPGGPFWSVVEGFAYDIVPAFIHGNLGIVAYSPNCYAILEEGADHEPLMGYAMTISCPDMIRLLDRMKGFLGENAFNWHVRKLVHAYTSPDKVTDAWAYVLAPTVLQAYQSVETVQNGMYRDDPKEQELLEKVMEGEEE